MRLAVEFLLQLLAGAAHAGAGGIAGLRHEAVDDAVEDDAIIEFLTRQLLDAGDMVRCEIGAERDHGRALRRLEDERVLGVLDLGHFWSPFRVFWDRRRASATNGG